MSCIARARPQARMGPKRSPAGRSASPPRPLIGQLGGPLRDVVTEVAIFRHDGLFTERLEVTRLEAQRETIDLHSCVVVVVLTLNRVTHVLEHRDEDVAEDTPAAMTDVKRAVGIRGHELHLNAFAGAGRAPSMIRPTLRRGPQHVQVPAVRQCEVNKTGPGDLHRRQMRDPGKVLDDRRSDLARRPLRRSRSDERGVRRPVAVRPISRPLHHERQVGELRKIARFMGNRQGLADRSEDGFGEHAGIVSCGGPPTTDRYTLASALVAQGIEHRPPEPGAQVRILPGALCLFPGRLRSPPATEQTPVAPPPPGGAPPPPAAVTGKLA